MTLSPTPTTPAMSPAMSPAPTGVSEPAGGLHEAARWGAVTLPSGRFTLHDVNLKRDLPLLHGWMNDPAVSPWWGLAGPAETTRSHLATQAGTAHSSSYLGCLDDEPVSYWELYRADLDPLAAYYPARPHDAGIHVLIGPSTHRGHGLGSLLISVVADLVLRACPGTTRVVAEPDARNSASVYAFRKAGFRHDALLELPDKTAALMVRDRPAVTRP